ncbi:MAG: energy transducer TonB [Desulfuromonadales bacterium]|nr:energy transducer TonB [Desulfuromonadales bacterium]MDW7757760.1 energy transducer TonB [Desulfuromonadales bacterium]
MSKTALIFWTGVALALHAALLLVPSPISRVRPLEDNIEVAFQTLPVAVVSEPTPTTEVHPEVPEPDPQPPATTPPKPAITPPEPKPLPVKEVTDEAVLPKPKPVPVPLPRPEPSTEPAKEAADNTQLAAQPQRVNRDVDKRPSAPANALVEAVPVYADNPPPTYPRLARERGWQGEVLLRARVSRGGRVLHVQVEESSGYALLDRAAVKAVKSWRFRPAHRGDHAVEAEVRLPVRFQLQSS